MTPKWLEQLRKTWGVPKLAFRSRKRGARHNHNHKHGNHHERVCHCCNFVYGPGYSDRKDQTGSD